MSKIKRILTIMLTLILSVGVMPALVSAVTSSSDSLEVTLTTDKNLLLKEQEN